MAFCNTHLRLLQYMTPIFVEQYNWRKAKICEFRCSHCIIYVQCLTKVLQQYRHTLYSAQVKTIHTRRRIDIVPIVVIQVNMSKFINLQFFQQLRDICRNVPRREEHSNKTYTHVIVIDRSLVYFLLRNNMHSNWTCLNSFLFLSLPLCIVDSL